MDLLSSVGRRSLGHKKEFPSLIEIGENSLNGFEHNRLFENDGKAGFEEVAYHRGADCIQDGRAVVAFDFDADGDLDLFVTNRGAPPRLLRNDGGHGNWIQLKLVGTRSNRDAVGARITLETGGVRQIREVAIGGSFLAAGSLLQHFGLGPQARADTVTIRWPSGAVQVLRDVAANQRLRVVEPGP